MMPTTFNRFSSLSVWFPVHTFVMMLIDAIGMMPMTMFNRFFESVGLVGLYLRDDVMML